MSKEDKTSKVPTFMTKMSAQLKEKNKSSTEEAAENSATLSRKMAAISSLRESTLRGGNKMDRSSKERGKILSSLPDALARIDRHLTLKDSEPSGEDDGQDSGAPAPSQGIPLENVVPGSVRSLFWYLFRFGLYTRGPLRSQGCFTAFGMLLVLSVAMSAQSMVWLGPGMVSSGSLYISTAFLMRLALSSGIAFAVYTGAGWCFGRLARRHVQEGGWVFGISIVVNACAPLMVAQTVYILVHHAFLGEAFWRGVTLNIAQPWNDWVFPLVWVWSGIRLSQAACGLLSADSGLYEPIALILLFIPAGISAGFHPAVVNALKEDMTSSWDEQRKYFLASEMMLDADRFSHLERQLPFHATDARSELYLYRLQVFFREGNFDAALAEARRLDRLSPRGTSMDFLAKGLSSFLEGSQERAIEHWSRAIDIDYGNLPAHRWLALVSVSENPAKAERHARVLMQTDPNVFHLFLLVRILESRDKPEDIWQAMLEVNAPPEKWYPMTLLHGGLAAEKLGKPRRAEQLLRLAREKGLTPATGTHSIQD